MQNRGGNRHQMDDVDMKKRTININHSLTYYTRSDNSFKCEFRVSEPKTEAGIRTIPMMGPVYEVLKSEYQRQQEEGFCVAEVDGMTTLYLLIGLEIHIIRRQ